MAHSERANGADRRRAITNGGSAPRDRRASGKIAFFLYVEGPRDCEILRSWARGLSRPLERTIERSAVILGGRQPARAVEHYRREAERATRTRGLCVLDRDDGGEGSEVFAAEPGLEFFTWPRRHIESYLLVPDAIRRALDGSALDSRVERLLDEHLPSADSPDSLHAVDAKRLLGPQGALARSLGRSFSTAEIARAMRADEIHDEVHALFERVRDGAGLRSGDGPVVVRKRAAPGADEPQR